MDKLINDLALMKPQIRLNSQKNFRQILGFLCGQDTEHIQALLLQFSDCQSETLLHLRRANWSSLIYLDLSNNQIDAKGCKYLTRSSMEQLVTLYLSFNPIENEGVFHLSKGKWNNLLQLFLFKTGLREYFLKWMIRGNWSELKRINVEKNQFRRRQVIHLIFSHFDFLAEIFFRQTGRQSEKKQFIEKVLKDRFQQLEIIRV